MEGTGVHADIAALNVNLFITPSESNLDPDTGGMVLFHRPAPPEWGFTQFNSGEAGALGSIDALLRETQ